MKNRILYLVIGIPASAVLMAVVSLYLAFSNPDPGVPMDQPALSKMSWKVSE